MLVSKGTSAHYHTNNDDDYDAGIITKIPAASSRSTGDLSSKGKKAVIVHRRRLSKRSPIKKVVSQNGTAAIQSSGERSSNKTAVDKSTCDLEQVGKVELVLSANSVAGGGEYTVRKVSNSNTNNKNGKPYVRNRNTRKRISSHHHRQGEEMRDEKEERKRSIRSPVGLKLHLHDMLLEPEVSDLTSIPSLTFQHAEMDDTRDEVETELGPAEEVEPLQEGNTFLSHLVRDEAPSLISQETPVRRGQTKLVEPLNHRRLYRSSYMNEAAVQQNGEKGLRSIINNSADLEEEKLASIPNYKYPQDIRGGQRSKRYNAMVPSCSSGNNQTYCNLALNQVTSATHMQDSSQQRTKQMPIQNVDYVVCEVCRNGRKSGQKKSCSHTTKKEAKWGQRGIVSIPPSLATNFGLSKTLAETRAQLNSSDLDPVIIANTCSQQEQSHDQFVSDKQPTQIGHNDSLLLAPTLEGYLESEREITQKQISPCRLFNPEDYLENGEVGESAKDLHLTKMSKKGKWKRIVEKQVGLKRERRSKEKEKENVESDKNKNQQAGLTNLFGFRHFRRKGMVAVSQDRESLVQNSLLLNTTEPLAKTSFIEAVDDLTNTDSTKDSIFPTPVGSAEVHDYLSVGLCGLGFLTCMLSEEDIRKKLPVSSTSLTSQRKHLEDVGSSISTSFMSDESHSDKKESTLGFFVSRSRSFRGNSHDIADSPSRLPKVETRPKFSILKPSVDKDRAMRLSDKEAYGKPPDKAEHPEESHLDTFQRRSVTFDPVLLNDASPFCFSPFNKCAALAPGRCTPLSGEEIGGQPVISLQKWSRKSNECVPVTREMMFECNEFFTERKELKGDRIIPVESDIPSASALRRRLLRFRGNHLRRRSLSKPVKGLTQQEMEAKPQNFANEESQEKNWNLMKSLLDDDSSYHQTPIKSSNHQKTRYKKKANSRGLIKDVERGSMKKKWKVNLFR